MRKILIGLLAVAVCGAALLPALAQPPGKGKGKDKGFGRGEDGGSLVEKMMAFDKNKDGKLTREEVTDTRLTRLFERIDADRNDVVTKEELTAFAAKMAEEDGKGGGKGKGKGKGGDGFPGGPGGPGGFRGPPRPGTILPPFLAEQLGLTAEQQKQLAEMQKDVDAKLAKLLTAEQKKKMEEFRPGRLGGPGGRDGKGGPGGDGKRPPRD
jgi:hypothetical protein